MLENRVLWGISLFLLALLFFFTESPIPLYLVFAFVLTPAASLLWNMLHRRQLETGLALAETAEIGEQLGVKVTLKNSGKMPFPTAALVLCCENLLTGENFSRRVMFSVAPRSEAVSALEISSRRCGKLRLTVTALCVYDFFGLFSVKSKFQGTGEALILPDIFGMEITVGKSSVPDLDCDTFSPYKPGNDPSETFAIREYKPGDSLKSIHWKLTGKFDQLMVREASLPLNESVLILFERVEQRGYAPPAAEVSAALGEIVVSLSRSLVDQGCAHCIGWLNPGDVFFSEYSIDSEESFSLILPQILTAASVRFDGDTVDYYLMRFDSCPYTNIIYVSPYASDKLPLLNPLSRVTMILCAGTEAGAGAESNAAVYTVTPENYRRSLYEILV